MCGETAAVMPARSAASCSTCHALCRDSRPPRALRKIAGVPSRQLGTASHEVRVQCGDRGTSDRHKPLLAALTPQQHRTGVSVDVVDVEPDRFGDSRAGGVEQLEQCAAAQCQRTVGLAVAACALQKGEHLVDGQALG